VPTTRRRDTFADGQPTAWQGSLPGIFDYAWQIATDGHLVVVAGYGTRPWSRRDWVVNAYDAGDGILLWSDILDSAGGFDEAVGGVAFQGGQVFVHGVVDSGSANLDLLIRAYEASSGRVLWQDHVDKDGGLEFPPGLWQVGLAADRSRVAIVGSTFGPDGWDWVVRTYDASKPGRANPRSWDLNEGKR